MACYLGSNLIMPQLHITADKRKIRDFPNCLRQLLLSAKRYMKVVVKKKKSSMIKCYLSGKTSS
jgi:hypothetical protein